MRWSMCSPPARGSLKFRIAMAQRSGLTDAAKQWRLLGRKRNAEELAKAVLPFGGDFQRARIADTRDPAELKAPAGKSRAKRAGKMQAALAPVHTGAAERATATLDVLEMNAEVGKEFLAGARDHAAVLAEHDVPLPSECVGERAAKTAGDMVVAGARGAQLFAAVPAWAITLRRVDGDHHDAFDHARDLRRAKPKITMAALLGH